MTTFTEAVEAQSALMRAIAVRLDERGYAVVFDGLNKDGTNSNGLYRYFGGGFGKLVTDVGSVVGRHAPLVWVNYTSFVGSGNPPAFTTPQTAQDVLAGNFLIQLRLPKLKNFAPLLTALEMMAHTYERKERRFEKGVTAGRLLTAERASDHITFRGEGRAALKVLLRVLDMPHHRDILTRRRRNAKP